MSIGENFVFFRYPNSQPFMMVDENEGEDSFVFVDFLCENRITINGEKIEYSEKYDYCLSSNQSDFHISSKEEYLDQFRFYKKAFAQNKIKKAILSRISEHEIKTDNLHQIFTELSEAYPNAMVYVANLGEYGVWAGATPERLLKYEKGVASTVALAGTKKSNSPEVWGEKERLEHREVEKFIEKITTDNRFNLLSKSPVYIKKAGKVFHQKSDFEIKINKEDVGSFLDQLHPTPAVCGTPLIESRDLILRSENHDRSFYTGYLGLLPSVSSNVGQFEFFVNLRCMQLKGKKAFLYLGGGITEGSDGLSEWQETIDKSKTLLFVLGK